MATRFRSSRPEQEGKLRTGRCWKPEQHAVVKLVDGFTTNKYTNRLVILENSLKEKANMSIAIRAATQADQSTIVSMIREAKINPGICRFKA